MRLGYYDQENRALDEEARVIDYVREVAERIETADGAFITAGQMLEKFLFTGAMQYAPIAKLSGGERRRLYLLRVLMGAPNVLLLDEPTNDFDIRTLVTLEDYLDGFAGCLVVVSHDRYFLDRTAEHIFRFEGGGQRATVSRQLHRLPRSAPRGREGRGAAADREDRSACQARERRARRPQAVVQRTQGA